MPRKMITKTLSVTQWKTVEMHLRLEIHGINEQLKDPTNEKKAHTLREARAHLQGILTDLEAQA